jgi:hypothetical protein
MVSGEYDLRDPIDEVYRVFDQITGPAELWVFADQFHRPSFAGSGVYPAMLDWLRARLDGEALARPNRVRYIEPGATGPAGAAVSFRRRWYEAGDPA